MTDTRLAELAAQRAARKDTLDLPRTMTQREVNAYHAETVALDAKIHALRTASDTLAEVGPALDANTKWLGHLTAWRAALVAELLQIKFPIRDRSVKERADALDFSIRLIDYGLGASTLGPVLTLAATPIGRLMREADYATESPALTGPRGWRGSVKDVEERIKALTQQQATAQAHVDAALLTDAERATREAAHATRRELLESMQIRRNADGTGLVAFTPDGDPLDPAAMTPEQRTAFAALS